MSNSPLDQAVMETMDELMRASSDCAEFDPAMSAKFAIAAKDLGRDLGVTFAQSDPDEAAGDQFDRQNQDEDDETRELLYLLDLQKKAIAETDRAGPTKGRLGWLGLDVWSRW